MIWMILNVVFILLMAASLQVERRKADHLLALLREFVDAVDKRQTQSGDKPKAKLMVLKGGKDEKTDSLPT